MAYSFTGPPSRTESASPTAPLPRPPHPIKARRIVLSSPAWTLRAKPLTKGVAAAIMLDCRRNCRRASLVAL